MTESRIAARIGDGMGTTSTAKGKPAAIAALAGARAIPPLLIVLYHFSEGHHYSGIRLIDLIATRGYLWVEFFFTLSGFILTHVYGGRVRELWTRKGYLGFLKARLLRLYPLHLFLLLLLVCLVIGTRTAAHFGGYLSIYDRAYHPMIDAKGFVLSLLLVQGWNTLNYLTWNGVAWFVSVEFALCLLFPLFLKMQDGRAWRGVALVAAGIGGMMALLDLKPTASTPSLQAASRSMAIQRESERMRFRVFTSACSTPLLCMCWMQRSSCANTCITSCRFCPAHCSCFIATNMLRSASGITRQNSSSAFAFDNTTLCWPSLPLAAVEGSMGAPVTMRTSSGNLARSEALG